MARSSRESRRKNRAHEREGPSHAIPGVEGDATPETLLEMVIDNYRVYQGLADDDGDDGDGVELDDLLDFLEHISRNKDGTKLRVLRD